MSPKGVISKKFRKVALLSLHYKGVEDVDKIRECVLEKGSPEETALALYKCVYFVPSRNTHEQNSGFWF